MASLEALMLQGPGHNVEDKLKDLRKHILLDGIPANSEGRSEVRIYAWLILLNVPPLSTDVYLDLVRQGASPAHAKIQNDAFRTFQGDPLFRRRVTQNSITRVLNAVAWRLNDAHEARVNGWMSPPTLSEFGGSPDTSLLSRTSLTTTTGGGLTEASTTTDAEQIGYVQGMNVLCGPFLYAARSEVEAFAAFEKLITRELPGYVRGSMEGVHKGLALVDRVLQECDPRLYQHLMSHRLEARIYAFPSVLTLCACTPRLPDVLQLWDFLFAYGPHLNILCIVAQLILIRDELLQSSSPNQILRNLPSLNAKATISQAVRLAASIPDDLYDEIVNHAK
ncbi:cell division control protein-like protein [Westerdykella ornata]|uniref:Cell division control protein-like protein n=1 Tax=Westerdykella ornata TaxID=318751 RepID=A0A6A6JYT3_WESOR|nr:cell division control protein-like protein [Westerdykella ornata]KAF2281365.1 cell division control protein-like protein [Westerdykella ornata]